MKKVVTILFLISIFLVGKNLNAQDTLLFENFEGNPNNYNWTSHSATSTTEFVDTAVHCPNKNVKAQFRQNFTSTLQSGPVYSELYEELSFRYERFDVTNTNGVSAQVNLKLVRDTSNGAPFINLGTVSLDSAQCQNVSFNIRGFSFPFQNFWVDTFPEPDTASYFILTDTRLGSGGQSIFVRVLIDNILIEGRDPDCDMPMNMTATTPTSNSANVSWSGSGDYIRGFLVEAVPQTCGASEVSMMVSNTSSSTTLNGLSAGSVYDVNVYTICLDGDTSLVATQQVNTSVTCVAPTGLMQTSVFSNAVNLSWSGSGNDYSVKYGPSGFDPCIAGTEMFVSGTSTTISGLSASVNYDAYVREICGAADTSDWSNALSFTTSATGLELHEEMEIVRIFPVPAKEIVHVTINGKTGQVNISVMDLMGKEVMNKKEQTNGGENTTDLDVSELPAGAYYITIDSKSGPVQRMIWIE